MVFWNEGIAYWKWYLENVKQMETVDKPPYRINTDLGITAPLFWGQ